MQSFLSSLGGALALLATLLPAIPAQAQVEPGMEDPGFHGMLLFGSERIYISHLPMFVPQHRYQAIWEVSLGADADAAYRAERARPENDGVIFTIAPVDTFRLPELTTTRDSFEAEVVVGHFEAPHPLFLEGRTLARVTVTLQQPVHWHPFLVEDRLPDQATYVLFGADEELFLAHWISAAPNYDQILAVEPSASLGPLPPGAQLVALDRDDDRPLRSGEVVPGLMLHRDRPDGPVDVSAVELTVRAEIYLEQRELSFTKLAMQ